MTDQQKVQLLPRFEAYRHLRATGTWPSGVPEWAKNHEGRMDDITLRNAVIEELAQAALAHASSATGKENLTVGAREAVACGYVTLTVKTKIENGVNASGCITPSPRGHNVYPVYIHSAPSAEYVRDAERFRFIVEHNWIGTKTRCKRGIQDSDITSARQAIDQALAAERGEA